MHNSLPETSEGILEEQERQEHKEFATLFSVSMSCKIKTCFCRAQTSPFQWNQKPETTEASGISEKKALSFAYIHFWNCLI